MKAEHDMSMYEYYWERRALARHLWVERLIIRYKGVEGENGVIEGDALSRKYMHCNYDGWPFSSDLGTM